MRDSRGYLWFCTREGLARFDGYRFTRYDSDPRLAGRPVNDLLEAREGFYWIATGSGLIRFDPRSPEQKITEISTTTPVTSLLQDDSGTLWCGTSRGLYRLDPRSNTLNAVEIGLTKDPYHSSVSALVEDRGGTLWIATSSGLFRHNPNGRVDHFSTGQGLPAESVQTFLEDRDGNLWAGSASYLCRVRPDAAAGDRIVNRCFHTEDGLIDGRVQALVQTADGTLWIGTSEGLSKLEEGLPARFTSYTTAEGLSDRSIIALAEDSEGNLWAGTESSGAVELVRSGLTAYLEPDGLTEIRIASIFEDRNGHLIVSSQNIAYRFDGRRFIPIHPNFGPRPPRFSWGWYQTWLQDHTGEWWVPTAEGLYRFPAVDDPLQLSRLRPKAIYTTRDGLFTNDVFRLFEDSRGDVWISVVGRVSQNLCRWERATGTIHRYVNYHGLGDDAATAFAQDRAGNLWVGFYEGGVARLRSGRFEQFAAADGVPAGSIRAFHLDHAGSLWIATSGGGAARVDDPAADHPRFTHYNTTTGLVSNQVLAVTEDDSGRIYLGTGRGIERLDPGTKTVRHFTVSDGLPNNVVNVAYRDRAGSLWFGTLAGLARLVPKIDSHPKNSPPILISGLRVAGQPHPISDLGEKLVPRLDLKPHQNQVQIDFVSPNFRSGEMPRYQFRLEGADEDWGSVTDQRSVTYANLSPGRYRFLVRAIREGVTPSTTPAQVSFTILPPLWRRWWFMTLMSILGMAAIYSLYRIRLRRLLELERVRTRIASDLHDDIGASLSRMAILSEVVRRDLPTSNERASQMVGEIADSARNLVDSMSDIVWSVDPRRDDLASVVRRVRHFAAEVLEAKQIAWTFEVPPDLDGITLGPEQRRHLYLLFKEAIHNVVKHSECRTVALAINVTGGALVVEIQDDGRGIESAGAAEGHGIHSMHQRARQLGGRLEITSAAAGGTELRLTMPIRFNPA